ncbi:zinc finger protein 706-like [Pholidichthys leucotaenia]
MVMDDRRLTVNQLAKAVGVSRERVENILHNQLGMSGISMVSARSKPRAMALGQHKIQSQQKNAKKAAEKKKSQGADQKTAAQAALVHICLTQMPDPQTFKQHCESKHPNSPMLPEVVDGPEPGCTMTTDQTLNDGT